MSERSGTLSATEQIVNGIPEACNGCDTAFKKCCAIARRVIDGEVTIDQAQGELLDDLAENCRGNIQKPRGWGELQDICTYKPPT